MNDYQEIEKMLGREMTDNEFWAAGWARLNQVEVADIVSVFKDAAARGASLSELMDILDDSCFDGDICEFLQDNTMPYQ